MLPDGGTKSKRASWELQGTTTSVLASNMVNEARFQYSQFVNESTNLAPGPRVIYTGLGTYGANNGSPQDIRENRIQFNDKLSRDFARTGRLPASTSHIAKTGVPMPTPSASIRSQPAATPSMPVRRPSRRSSRRGSPTRRPITLHRDFAPFDFAGIDRST